MLIFNINGYEDFQSLFGMEAHGNGVKSRKNKILLAHLKNPALIRYCREHDDWSLLHIRSMAELKQLVLGYIRDNGKADPNLPNKVILIGNTYWSSQYRTDHMEGLCEDFDKKSVRYVNTKAEHVYKMKAGKFFSAIIKETEIGQILSEQVVIWLSEEFTQDWQTYTMGQTPDAELHIDDNFAKIYDEYYCRSFNGCSCMVGRDRHSFYEDAVEAKAAYLTDKEGFVLARAIIFTDVIDDETGKKWRLLERQYSKESSDVLKRLLVDLCIKGGHIDGYKQIGAGCSESRAFVQNDGTSLSDKKFSIKCELDTYDTLSYQDSFKYYDYDNSIAYNYADSPHDYCLDTTDVNLDGDSDEDEEQEYDEYHDYNCDEVRTCYYHGNAISVDVDNLEDFVWVDSEDEYFHKDDVSQCDACGEWVVKENATYNSEVEAYFCDSECEAKYLKDNFFYSEYDDDYYRNEEDITTIQMWDEETQCYKEITISCMSRDWLIREGKAFGGNGLWFISNDQFLKQTA